MGRVRTSAPGIGNGVNWRQAVSVPARRGVVLHGPQAAVHDVSQRAAAVDCPLLIVGETGVGKGVMAQWIHANSARSDGPFVPVNCGAIPESLIDSQLFGHARGAFSGADKSHLGLVRAAEGGTLLLDEIGELPLTAQTRLLRLLEEREAQPVGYSRPVTVNVRIIVAANRDLRQAVAAGTFREDLFFRLDIIRIDLKPLRECPQEIPALVEQFNAEFATLYEQPVLEFEPTALGRLKTYHWPGNVRQLRTVVERLHVLCRGEHITARHLETVAVGAAAPADRETLPKSLHEARLDALSQALATHGSISRAASALGVHRSTVYRWLSRQPMSA